MVFQNLFLLSLLEYKKYTKYDACFQGDLVTRYNTAVILKVKFPKIEEQQK